MLIAFQGAKIFSSVVAGHGLLLSQLAWFRQAQYGGGRRSFVSSRYYGAEQKQTTRQPAPEAGSRPSSPSSHSSGGSLQSEVASEKPTGSQDTLPAPPSSWEDDPDWSITKFSELPSKTFGWNQHMRINEDFKETLRQMLWEFRAPIRYAFAYGSGVFSQVGPVTKPSTDLSPHPHPPEAIVKWQKGGGKVIDFIFGVSHTQHWHSLNIQQHPDHYSALRLLGSATVSHVQDKIGAGVYFNPYININGTMIKYGVVNLDTLQRDLSQWDTLYLAGRLHKPVKILRDDPRVRLANQLNLISALRTALLMLGPKFTEMELYSKITSISYLGDPRMSMKGEDPNKIHNIVSNQLPNFRQLYAPLVLDLPNVSYNDARSSNPDWMIDPDINCTIEQDEDPVKRGNMVRRLPISFRSKLYMEYRKKWQIPGREFAKMMEDSRDEDETGFKRRQGGRFDQRIAEEGDVSSAVVNAIKQTVSWPSWTQSLKGFPTAGVSRSLKYIGEKRKKGQQKKKEAESTASESQATQDDRKL
jgi:translocator assembly and maintenance protein 41